MIGLKRGIVKLESHQAGWSKLFQTEKHRLQKAIPAIVSIEHVGSTAVPGLKAKPIIDIDLGVKSLKKFRREIPKMKKLGYWWKRDYPGSRQHLFFAKGPEKSRSIYIHVVRYQGPKWQRDIFFRDQLVRNPSLRRRYEAIKKLLAKRYPSDREQYTSRKQPFIFQVLNKKRP